MITTFKPLDKFLVDTGKVASFERAQDLIRSGSVRVNGAVIMATVCPVFEGHKIEIDGIEGPWISPQAVKLFSALEGLTFDVRGRTAIDLGAGEGGFAEVLIQRGAVKVFAVDREFGKLHSSLILSPRVKNLQKTEANSLTKNQIDEDFDLVVCDMGDEGVGEALAAAASIANGACDILVFMTDKKAAKDLEKFLRLEKGFLIKKVPESLQKEAALVWAYKKA